MKLTVSLIPGLDAKQTDSSREVIAPVDREVTVLEASKLMRKVGVSELLVMGETDGLRLPLGVITATDIVTRVIAAELNPAVLTMGDIAWTGLGVANKT